MYDSRSGQERELTGATINQRVAIVDRALRIIFPDAPHQAAPVLQTNYWQRAPMGIGKPRPALSRLRVKTPKRTIVPLSVDEVARFWSSFRNSRDLAIVGLMLLQGLRSQEVLDLNRDDLLLSEAQIRVRGKLIFSVKNDAKHEHKDPAHYQKRGFEVDLVHAIARRLFGDESRVELRLLARPVRLPMLAAGAVDLVVSMVR